MWYKIGERLVAEGKAIRYDANEAARPQPDPTKSGPRPHPCLCDAGAVGVHLIVNYLAQKSAVSRFLIDLNAVQKLDYQNMIRIDFR